MSDLFIRTIANAHVIAVRATAFDGSSTTPKTGGTDLRVVSGSVRVDTKSAVRRSLSATIASPDGTTATLSSVLTTTGTELLLERGVTYPDGSTEYAPVGRFRVDAAEETIEEPGALKVTGGDRWVRLADDGFTSPRTAPAGAGVGATIQSLIQETIPSATVANFDAAFASATIGSGVVWEKDRGQALLDLAASIGATLYADPVGNFTLSMPKSAGDPADWTVMSGGQGVIIGGTRTASRAGVYNSVVVTSSSTSGTPPVYAVSQDTDPTSDTYVSGPFGRVTRYFSSPLITTTGQAQAAADSILKTSKGQRVSIALQTLVNPALEAGDRLDVMLPDGFGHFIADAITVPLTPDAASQIDARYA